MKNRTDNNLFGVLTFFLIFYYAFSESILYKLIPTELFFQISILIVSLIYIMYKGTIQRFSIALFVYLLFLSSLSNGIFYIGTAYALYVIYILFTLKDDIFVSKYVYIAILIIMIVVNIYSIFFLQSNRVSYAGNNANFSAFIMLALFMLFYKLKYKYFSIIPLIFGIMTMSRMFILSFFLFFIVEKYKEVFFRKLSLFYFFIILNIFYFITIFGVLVLFMNNPTGHDSYIGRIFNFNDLSNFARIGSYREAFMLIYEDPMRFLLPTYFSEEMMAKTSLYSVAPHNAFLYLTMKFGLIISLSYFYLLFKLLQNNINKESISIVIITIFSSLFLHGLLMGYIVILIAIVVFLININKNKNLKTKEI